jgi:hypothetical protein
MTRVVGPVWAGTSGSAGGALVVVVIGSVLLVKLIAIFAGTHCGPAAV